MRDIPVTAMTPIALQVELQPASKVFKAPTDKMAVWQTASQNKLMKLGGEVDEIPRGRQRGEGNINCKATTNADMYLVDQSVNMLHRRSKDEYPLYAKDGSFDQAISTNVKKSIRKKADTQASHLQSLVQNENATDRLALVSKWNKNELNFRALISFRNALLASKHLDAQN